LQQGINVHTCLVASILESEGDERNLKSILEACSTPSRVFRMKEAIREAINELDESRKSFKSKRLEALRKRLTQVLIDEE
jgi:hypothetical protein